jgi:hypothetical protein
MALSAGSVRCLCHQRSGTRPSVGGWRASRQTRVFGRRPMLRTCQAPSYPRKGGCVIAGPKMLVDEWKRVVSALARRMCCSRLSEAWISWLPSAGRSRLTREDETAA